MNAYLNIYKFIPDKQEVITEKRTYQYVDIPIYQRIAWSPRLSR